MEEFMRSGAFERDVEQAITALKKGAQLLKYGRKGKPKFCPFRLSNDEKALIWFSGKEEMQLSLSLVTRIVPGQRTANFQRNPCPEKEYQSFSLIYGHDGQSMDLICKDKDQAELWFVGLKALIGSTSTKLRVDTKSDSTSSIDGGSSVGHMRRMDSMDALGMQSMASSAFYAPIDSRKSQPDESFLVDSRYSGDSDAYSDSVKGQTRDASFDGFRVSLSSVISSSSQGSGHDENDALGDVYMWGEGIESGIVGGSGSSRGANSSGDVKVDALLPKHLESAIVLDVHYIACGSRHAALVNRQGEVFCWGEESGGRLGHGVDADVPHPQVVEALSNTCTEFVACGEYHTCAVTLNGDLYAWGDGTRSIGLLGQSEGFSQWVPRKVALAEGIHISSVACGPWHTALVTSSGDLLTFGEGVFGALGHGDTKSTPVPRIVEALKGMKTIRASCGAWHTATVVEVMVGRPGGNACYSGKVFTWGAGDKGQLGHGDKQLKLAPTLVEPLLGHEFRQVVCGHTLTAALTTSGQVYTMGSSANGQLGRNPPASGGGGHFPGMVEGKLWEAFVEEIACGAYHMAALTSRTEVYTWGKGANGRLGHGDTLDRASPTLVEALKDKQVKSITCGTSFTAAICLHKWFSGADQSVCSGCRMSFGFTRKRHNCYNCGHVFCHACSSKKAEKAMLAPSPKKPYRVCDPCYMKLKVSANLRVKPQAMPPKRNGSLQQSSDVAEKSDNRYTKTQLSPSFQLNDQSKKLEWNASALFPPPSTNPSPPRSASAEPDIPDSALSQLKKTNRNLTQEILKMQEQNEALSKRYHEQDSELQAARKEAREAKVVAAEANAKWRAAMEVIKSLTIQQKDAPAQKPSWAYAHLGIDEPPSPKINISHGAYSLGSITTASRTQETVEGGSIHFPNHHRNATSPQIRTPRAVPQVKTAVSPSPYGTPRLDYWSSQNYTARAKLPGGASQDFLEKSAVANSYGTPKAVTKSPVNYASSPRVSNFQVPSSLHGTPRSALQSPHRRTSWHDLSRSMNDSLATVSSDIAREDFNPGVASDRNINYSKYANTLPLDRREYDQPADREWVEQDEPGVYITFGALPDGGKDLKRVRFSRKKFSEIEAEEWWTGNCQRIFEQYNVTQGDPAISGLQVFGKNGDP